MNALRSVKVAKVLSKSSKEKFDSRVRWVDNAVAGVEIRVPDAILTAMDNVVMPTVGMSVRTVTAYRCADLTLWYKIATKEICQQIQKVLRSWLHLAAQIYMLIIAETMRLELMELFENSYSPSLR